MRARTDILMQVEEMSGCYFMLRMTHLSYHLSMDTGSEIHQNGPEKFTRHNVVSLQWCRVRFSDCEITRLTPTDSKVCRSSLKFLY
jgi:hypothetical protein